MRRLSAVIIIVLLLIVAFIGFSKEPVTKSGKLQVATSFYPLYYFTTQIAGDKAVVKNITPSGAEPHDYDPSTADVADIEKGDMLILNGVVETWGDKIKENLKGTHIQIITAGQGLFTGTDPHVWLDPVLAKQETEAILQGLIRVDASDKDFFIANASELMHKLDDLDAQYKAGLRSCREKNIVTSHAAFGYLAKRYGLTQVPVAGLSPDAEPSAQQLADVVNFAKTNRVKYIFFESLVSPKLSQTVATEIGAKTLVLDPIEGVSDKDMKAGKTYYTIMQDNLRNLQLALSCTT